jgi:hypothetical protein
MASWLASAPDDSTMLYEALERTRAAVQAQGSTGQQKTQSDEVSQ